MEPWTKEEQTDRQAGRQTDRQTDRQTGRQTDRQAGRQTDRQADRQADRQTDRQREATRKRTWGLANTMDMLAISECKCFARQHQNLSIFSITEQSASDVPILTSSSATSSISTTQYNTL